MTVSDCGILGIAGDKERLQIGAKRSGGIGDLSAVHTVGQAYVGNEEIEPRPRLQHLYPGRTIRRSDHGVANLIEHLVD
ncbi:hypothetical protein GGR49_002853 [Sphingomonas carotinifaciens]|nr:hypothetical protein [Sphingomonas carotinifaciens]